MNHEEKRNRLFRKKRRSILLNLSILAAALAGIAAVFIFIPPRPLPEPKKSVSDWVAAIESLAGTPSSDKIENLKNILIEYDNISYGLFAQVEAHIKTLKEGDEKENAKVRKRIIQDAGRSALVPMLKLLERGKPFEKVNAIAVLGQIDEELAWPAVMEAARDGDPEVRLNAVSILGRKKVKTAADVFYEILDKPDPDGRVRYYALLGLSETANGIALSPILRKYALDPEPRMRALVIKTIESLGDAELVDIAKDLSADPDESVRAAAGAVLKKLGELPDNE